MGSLKIKRIYETPTLDDGIRIFVDRLWTRGISKEKAKLDYWFKDIAPSSNLRKWFNHEPAKFKEFANEYKKELQSSNDDIEKIREFLKSNNVTLIYAAKSPTINHARVLKDYIEAYKG